MDKTVVILWKYFPDEQCLRIIDSLRPKGIFIPKMDRIHLTTLLFEASKENRSPAVAFNSHNIFHGQDLVAIGSIYKQKLKTTAFPMKTSTGTGETTYIVQLIEI